MKTTIGMLKNWFEEGKERGDTHMIIVCDTFDYEDFPVYVEKDDNFYEVYDNYTEGKNMAHIMEVYDLSKEWDNDGPCKFELPPR